MSGDEKPPIPRNGVAMISDPDDPAPPQNIYDTTTLTALQLARLRARIAEHLGEIRGRKEASNFKRATTWVMKTFSYNVNLSSDFVPMPSYASSFLDFARFVDRKERDAEAEEVIEDEEGQLA